MYPPRLQSAVHINWGGTFPCEPDWSWNTRTTPIRDYDLWLVCDGRGTLTSADGEQLLREGSCLLLRPEYWYACSHDPNHPLLVQVLHFDFLDRKGRLWHPAAGQIPPLHTAFLDPSVMRELLHRAIETHEAGNFAQANAWLQAALQEIGREQQRAGREAQRDVHSEKIESLCRDIASHPAGPWRVEAMAEQCHLSPDHFSRVFKRERGLTPRQYVKRTRLDAARRLLLFSSHPMGRIAQLCGFSDVYHFSRQFKAATGTTPTAFRRMSGAAR